MDFKQVSKSAQSQKKLISQMDKYSKKCQSQSGPKKKKKNKKPSSSKTEPSQKEGDQSPEGEKNSLEVEGIGVLDNKTGIKS